MTKAESSQSQNLAFSVYSFLLAWIGLSLHCPSLAPIGQSCFVEPIPQNFLHNPTPSQDKT